MTYGGRIRPTMSAGARGEEEQELEKNSAVCEEEENREEQPPTWGDRRERNVCMLADEERPMRHGRGRAGGKLIARPTDQVHTGHTRPSEYGRWGKTESGAAISLAERVLMRRRDGMHSNTRMTTREGEVKEIGPTRTGSGGPEQQMEVWDKKGGGGLQKGHNDAGTELTAREDHEETAEGRINGDSIRKDRTDEERE